MAKKNKKSTTKGLAAGAAVAAAPALSGGVNMPEQPVDASSVGASGEDMVDSLIAESGPPVAAVPTPENLDLMKSKAAAVTVKVKKGLGQKGFDDYMAEIKNRAEQIYSGSDPETISSARRQAFTELHSKWEKRADAEISKGVDRTSETAKGKPTPSTPAPQKTKASSGGRPTDEPYIPPGGGVDDVPELGGETPQPTNRGGGKSAKAPKAQPRTYKYEISVGGKKWGWTPEAWSAFSAGGDMKEFAKAHGKTYKWLNESGALTNFGNATKAIMNSERVMTKGRYAGRKVGEVFKEVFGGRGISVIAAKAARDPKFATRLGFLFKAL